ncbi:GNAT family N-acetyltransferase [Mycobacteroides chelonae]|uniref:GNAT family N-acetyltransferase n=1 Tax=Mycobacteroides chelonae TaxID=1774 RepID=UPI00104214E4|nr:GNAT family N-acetyltransferase [Mycobacteroides chelonae]QQG85955.1 GNAT family N-acetyltransferase [Mycobacteroides chelonae]
MAHDTDVTSGANDTRRFLLDTNAFISLEPFDGKLEANLSVGAAFVRLCSRQGHRILVHPATRHEVVKGSNSPRTGQRIAELAKFEMVEASPISDALRASAGDSPVGTNDYIDLLFLASLASNAAHYLVSDDVGLRRRARRAGLHERVLRLADAAEILSDLEPDPPQLPPRVEVVKAYALDTSQQLFASIRADYDEFDDWFGRVQSDSDNRKCFVIKDHTDRYLAIAIVKDVEEGKDAPKSPDPISKISTFKVDPAHAGYRYGELLLKAVMRHQVRIGTGSTFVEVLPSVQHLPGFLKTFGFYEYSEKTKRGESIFLKEYLPSNADLEPLDFHVLYGPPAVSPRADIFVVPIRPQWHSQLFPDIEMSNEPGLFPEAELTRPWGNALRKAYLCNASTNLIEPGAALLFYQSGGRQRIEAVGVVEDMFRTKDAEQIICATAGRTVYSTAAIKELAEHRSGILAILFRHDRTLEPGWSRPELESQRVFSRPPQSISIVKGAGAQWVHSQLQTERR